uniref:GFA family protein n=1 Tax=Thaumasiovibrio occultus TaxID=1891184 RepID=UPI000B3545FC|nr:GFA family protein [Thaumasiovibrio occultus]
MTAVYQGACHCGFVTFEVCTEIDHVRVCNCSICTTRGTLNFRVTPEQIEIHTPLNQLRLYQWGSMTAKDYFCPHCGILPFRKPSQPTEKERAAGIQPFEGWAINVRCIQGIDIERLPVVQINGAAL